MFQPHVDLEKTSGGGTSTEETPVSSHVNSVSRSQDSEVTTFEFITAEEPFRGYSFEVSFFLLYLTSHGLCWASSFTHSFLSLPPWVVCFQGYNFRGCGAHLLSPFIFLRPQLCRNCDASPIQIMWRTYHRFTSVGRGFGGCWNRSDRVQ